MFIINHYYFNDYNSKWSGYTFSFLYLGFGKSWLNELKKKCYLYLINAFFDRKVPSIELIKTFLKSIHQFPSAKEIDFDKTAKQQDSDNLSIKICTGKS